VFQKGLKGALYSGYRNFPQKVIRAINGFSVLLGFSRPVHRLFGGFWKPCAIVPTIGRDSDFQKNPSRSQQNQAEQSQQPSSNTGASNQSLFSHDFSGGLAGQTSVDHHAFPAVGAEQRPITDGIDQPGNPAGQPVYEMSVLWVKSGRLHPATSRRCSM
jgi:hypothetical protein